MFIRREAAERAITDYLNERDQQAGEPERQTLNPAIAKLILDDVQNIRAIEARLKGIWIDHEGAGWCECTNCGGRFGMYSYDNPRNFCPNCGCQIVEVQRWKDGKFKETVKR